MSVKDIKKVNRRVWFITVDSNSLASMKNGGVYNT